MISAKILCPNRKVFKRDDLNGKKYVFEVNRSSKIITEKLKSLEVCVFNKE